MLVVTDYNYHLLNELGIKHDTNFWIIPVHAAHTAAAGSVPLSPVSPRNWKV